MLDEKNPHVMLEATWCCCNISTGSTTQIQRLVDKGVVPNLIKLLSCNSNEIFEQASWCVANISADCAKFKNLLIDSGVVQPLTKKILCTSDIKILKQTTWALANVCRGKNKNQRVIQFAAPAFIKVLSSVEITDEIDILNDSLMGLADVVDDDLVNTLCEGSLLPKLKEISKLRFKVILFPLLRILAYITNGDDVQTQMVINNGFLELFYELLADPTQDNRIRKEILWILSNITIGTPEQIYRAIIYEDRFDILVKYSHHENTEIKKEAVWTLCNSTKNALNDQIKYMVDRGMLGLFNDLLGKDQKVEILLTILEAMNYVLLKSPGLGNGETGMVSDDGANMYVEMMLNNGMAEKIEILQHHKDPKVYDLAVKLIENHFDLDEEM